jgi:putative ABC transport system permease protein
MRARDLASLRVLGFTKGEVSSILLGEMVIQVLVALPLGLAFGHLLVVALMSTVDPETWRLPIVVTPASYGCAALTTVVAATFAAWLVRKRLGGLDLIGVLKTRESP